MLNFRNTNIFFVALMVLLIVVDVINGISFFVYPLLVVVYSLVVAWGCISIQSNFFMPVLCNANTTDKKIAISFDDGPAVNYTMQLQSLLKDENIEAAFFFIGKNIPAHPELLATTKANGHIIGNHSYSHHFWFDLFSSKKMLADMKLMDAATVTISGSKPLLFRPPYGVMNPNLKKAIVKGGYTPIGWNVRSLDTVKKDADQLLNKMLNNLKPGAIYLFHDTSSVTLQILPAFIKAVKQKGFEFVRLDKLLNIQAYA